MKLTDESSMFNGFHGKFGNFVIKSRNGRTIISKLPRKSSKPPTALQEAQKNRFRSAVAYAKSVMADPEKAAAYAARLEPGQAVFHLALSEYLKSEQTLK